MGQFRLTENRLPWDLNEALHYGVKFSAVEALQLARAESDQAEA